MSASVESVFEDALAQMNEAMAKIESTIGEEEARFAVEAKEYEEPLAKIAEARRRGEAGRNWQVLQQRIDLNETTMEAIMSGADESEEAAVARAEFAALGPALREEYVQSLGEEAMTPALASVHEAQAELAAQIEEIQALLEEL